MDYKTILQLRDKDYPIITDALTYVVEFIKRHNLIIYGGQAIDFALRLKGDKIYEDDYMPDYDFYSPTNIEHAYELADILSAKGFRNVSAIRAIHPQTMRVRIDYVSCADISFIPLSIYEKLPFIMYSSMRVIHPNFQRMDMHLSLCFPYNDPPREDINHRWEKDIGRFNRLTKHYPISTSDMNTDTHILDLPADAIFTGFAAYAILCKPEWIHDGKLTLPTWHKTIDMVTTDPIDATHHPWLDVIPKSRVDGCIKTLCFANKLIAIVKHNGYIITTVQYTLAWFLHHAMFVSDMYMPYYLEILKHCDDITLSSPFIPSVVVHGKYNMNTSLMISLAQFDLKKNKINSDILEYLPSDYYTKSNSKWPAIEVSKNELFQHDGSAYL